MCLYIRELLSIQNLVFIGCLELYSGLLLRKDRSLPSLLHPDSYAWLEPVGFRDFSLPARPRWDLAGPVVESILLWALD